jgi:hypothetical protein
MDNLKSNFSSFNPIKFQLSAKAGLENIEQFNKLTGNLSKLVENRCLITPWFISRKEQLLKIGLERKQLSLFLNSYNDIRVVIYLWFTDNQFMLAQPITEEILNRFLRLRTKLSPTHLSGLAYIYFKYYDELPYLYEFRSFILLGFSQLNLKHHFSKEIMTYRDKRQIIFSENAPIRIINEAKKWDISLEQIADELFIPIHSEYRFYTVCKDLYS